MLLDGHAGTSVAERLGLSGTNLLYRWKREQLAQSGPVASALDVRVIQLEAELWRVERERDILKKRLSHFQPKRMSDVVAAADQISAEGNFEILEVCHFLSIPRSSFYEHRSCAVSPRELETRELTPLVMDIFGNIENDTGRAVSQKNLQMLGRSSGADASGKS